MDPQLTLTVQDTNQQALASKISAVRKGYFMDPYAEQFAPFKGNRDILMHRGYWARVHLVKTLTENFLQSSQQSPIQIISLGSGLQTLWFNLMTNPNNSTLKLKFIELDLPIVIQKKIKKIQKSKKIQALFKSLGVDQYPNIGEYYSALRYQDKYYLQSCDLSSVEEFKVAMEKVQIDYSQPTFLYCECVLSYIDSQKVDSLLRYVHDNFRMHWLFDYEMYNPKDRFGQMMCKNFEERGCPLIGIHAYPNLEDQRHRFQKAGYKGNEVELDSMDKIYYHYIEKSQRAKIEKLEMLDELEEWNIIMGHYFALLAHSNLNPQSQTIEKQMLNKIVMKQQ